MLQLPGPAAFSAFRIAKLLERLQARAPEITEVAARFVHFVDLAQPLAAREQGILAQLLTYGPRLPLASEEFGEQLLVVPRAGTISPWSSKATDIAQVCGVSAVRRIERGIAYRPRTTTPLGAERLQRVATVLFDRMTEEVWLDPTQVARLFEHAQPLPAQRVSLRRGRAALEEADRRLGLALSAQEMEYLLESFARLRREPSDVELMMFAQINSEHCRHKIFNSHWVIDGRPREESLFDMIRHTRAVSPAGILSAYHDNAAVITGNVGERYFPDPASG